MDDEVDAFQYALVLNLEEILSLLLCLVAVGGSSLPLLETNLHGIVPVEEVLALEVLQEMEVPLVYAL